MKYLKYFESNSDPIIVDDVVEKYGEEDAAEYLNYLLINKKISIKFSDNDKIYSGDVKNIKFLKNTYVIEVVLLDSDEKDWWIKNKYGNSILIFSDIVNIHGAKIYCEDILDFDDADAKIKVKKYNL